MRTQTFKTMDEAYYAIYDECRKYGDRSEHRAGPCLELRPYAFTLKRPMKALFTGAARRLNYRFWAAETLCYLAGWGEREAQKCAELLVKLNSNYVNFSRGSTATNTEFGPLGSAVVYAKHTELMPMVRYGDAFGPGLARCYDTLKAKPMSRQAYVSIHDRDTPHTHPDLPCGASAQYIAHPAGGEGWHTLSGLYTIRSNDMNWGMPYDVASNCCLLATLAGSLGMAVGEYHHVAGSMHYYVGGEGRACRPPAVSPPAEEVWLADPPRIPAPTHVCDVRVYQGWADGILREMHRHFVVEGRPGHNFCPVLKGGEHSASPWVSQWVDVIRWRHPK